MDKRFIIVDGGKAFHSEFTLLVDEACGHLVDSYSGKYGLEEGFDEVIGTDAQFIEVFIVHEYEAVGIGAPGSVGMFKGEVGAEHIPGGGAVGELIFEWFMGSAGINAEWA